MYLISQMDSDQYVPIVTVANLDHVKKLSTDVPLIVDVLRCEPRRPFLARLCARSVAFRHDLSALLSSSATGAGGREGGEGAAQSEPLHRDPQGGPREHASGGDVMMGRFTPEAPLPASHVWRPFLAPLQEVEALFKGNNLPKFINCEFAYNDNWFITFESEADAQQVAAAR